MNFDKFFALASSKGIQESQIQISKSKALSIELFRHEIENFTVSDSQSIIAAGIVEGFDFLAERDMPWLVHCVEGKDRSGFASMMLEALMGWDEEQIVADYMMSYENYYGIEAGTDKYDLIAEKNVKEMLRVVAGLDAGASMEGVDLLAAAETYLLSHGMEKGVLECLEAKLR